MPLEECIFKQLSRTFLAEVPRTAMVSMYYDGVLDEELEANAVIRPAVYIDFGEVEWQNNVGGYYQRGVLELRLLIDVETYRPYRRTERSKTDEFSGHFTPYAFRDEMKTALEAHAPATPLTNVIRVRSEETLRKEKARIVFEIRASTKVCDWRRGGC